MWIVAYLLNHLIQGDLLRWCFDGVINQLDTHNTLPLDTDTFDLRVTKDNLCLSDCHTVLLADGVTAHTVILDMLNDIRYLKLCRSLLLCHLWGDVYSCVNHVYFI